MAHKQRKPVAAPIPTKVLRKGGPKKNTATGREKLTRAWR